MKFCIFGKIQIFNNYKQVSQFSKPTIYKNEMTLVQDTNQWLNFVVHYLNMNMKGKTDEIIDLQLSNSLKWDYM